MDGRPTNQPTNRPTPSAVDLPNYGHRYCSLLLHAVTIYKWESLNLFLSHKLLKAQISGVISRSYLCISDLFTDDWTFVYAFIEKQETMIKNGGIAQKRSAKKSWKLVSVTLKGRTTFMMGSANLQ